MTLQHRAVKTSDGVYPICSAETHHNSVGNNFGEQPLVADLLHPHDLRALPAFHGDTVAVHAHGHEHDHLGAVAVNAVTPTSSTRAVVLV